MSSAGAPLPVARPVHANPPPAAAAAAQPSGWDRVGSVAFRIFASPLLMPMVGAGLLLAAAAVGSVKAITLGITGLFLIALPLYLFPRELYNEVNLICHAVYHYFKGYQRWSQITEDRLLFIGGLPLGNFGHLDQLRALGIRHVISITEIYEGYRPGFFHEPIGRREWEAAGIDYQHEDVNNSAPIPANLMSRIVRRIDEHVRANEPVYLHSFIGTSRCAAIAEAYLMHRGICANEAAAYNHVRQRHPQAAPSAAQRASIVEAVRLAAAEARAAADNSVRQRRLEAALDAVERAPTCTIQ